MAGRPVVFLEYYAGLSEGNRESRFIAAFGNYGYSVPMAIVGSGYRYSQGPADYYNVFKSMIQADQARPPAVDVQAWWRRPEPTVARLYVNVRNTTQLTLDSQHEAAVWGLAWEHKPTLGVTGMYVRAAVRVPLPDPLPPGGAAALVCDLPINLLVDWNNLHFVAAAEHRPGGTSGPYDMLQAVRPAAAGLTVVPTQVDLALPQGPHAAELHFSGPQVLTWSATTDVPWLVVSPASGGMDTVARVEAVPEHLRAGQQQGSVTFVASSADGMSFTAEAAVTATFDPSWSRSPQLPRRRLSRVTPTETPR